MSSSYAQEQYNYYNSYNDKNERECFYKEEGSIPPKRKINYKERVVEHPFFPNPKTGGKSCTGCPHSKEHLVHNVYRDWEEEYKILSEENEYIRNSEKAMKVRMEQAIKRETLALEHEQEAWDSIEELRNVILDHAPNDAFTKCWGTDFSTEGLVQMLRDLLVEVAQ